MDKQYMVATTAISAIHTALERLQRRQQQLAPLSIVDDDGPDQGQGDRRTRDSVPQTQIEDSKAVVL